MVRLRSGAWGALLASVLAAGLLVGAHTPASAATVSGLRAESTAADTLRLSWKAQSGAAKYRIYVSPTSSMPSRCEPHCDVVTPKNLSSPSVDVDDLEPGKTYWIKVSAINSSGRTITGWQSKPVRAQVSRTVFGVEASALDSTTLRLSWDAYPEARRYRLYVSPRESMPGACEPHCEVITPKDLDEPTFDVSGLDPGRTYWIKISALDSRRTISGWQDEPVRASTQSAAPEPSDVVTGITARSDETGSLTLSWNRYPGASRYRLYVSPSSNMPGRCEPHCQVITPSSQSRPSFTLDDLVPGGAYWIKISALDSRRTISGWQDEPVRAEVDAGSTVGGIRLSSPARTTLRVSWNRYPGAERYRLYVSPSSNMPGRCEPHCQVVRPSDAADPYFDVTGLRAGQTYWVKISAINSAGKTITGWQDQPVTVTLPGGGDADELTVASFNVKCASCVTPPSSRPPLEREWVDRRDDVASTIVSRRPDVIGIQEASQAWIYENGRQLDRSQFEDLLKEMKEAGGSTYALTNTHRNNCERSKSPTNCVYKDQGASKGTKIIYDTATLELVSQGSLHLQQTPGANERYLAWAILEQRSTGQRFIFGNVHLEPGDYWAQRKRQAEQAVAEIARRNGADLPVVVVGDFNSTRYFQPTNAPLDTFVNSGLVDPLGHIYRSPKISPDATAERRINANYNSYGNFSPQQRRYAEDENGSNLDYILTSPMRVLQWETVVNVGAGGDLVGPIPSDHNMLVAKVLP